MPDYSSKVCGNCDHWHELPEESSGIILCEKKPKEGQCRALPPSATFLPVVTQLGKVKMEGIRRLADYPTLMENYPACAKFTQRIKGE